MNSTEEKISQKTRSLEAILKQVKNDELVLPEFQREFVWEIEKSVTLFDSIFRNLFIGSLIISKPEFPLACKGFDFRPRGSKKHKPKVRSYKKADFDSGVFALLDGQQRTSSLCRALEGVDEIFVIFKSIKELKGSEYWNSVEGCVRENELINFIEGFDTKKPKTHDRFYVKISDFYHKGLRKNDTKLTEDYVKPRLNEMALSLDEEKILEEIFLYIYDTFKTEVLREKTLLSVQLLNMDLPSFCLYFERSNSQGVNLHFTDIIIAKVYVDFRLRDEIDKAKKAYTNLDDRKWWTEYTIRYLCYKDHNEYSKQSVLQNLDATTFNKYWAQTVRLLDDVLNYLIKMKWVISSKEIPFESMVMPIVSFLEQLPSNDFANATSKQIEYLRLWFFLSSLEGTYGGGLHGSSNVILKRDSKFLSNIGKNIYDKDFWKKFNIHFSYGDLLQLHSKNSAIFKGIMCFLNYSKNFINLKNDTLIDSSAKAKNEVHHIFPSHHLKKDLKITDNTDTILNKMFLCKTINAGISAKPPYEYLTDFKKTNSKINNSLLAHRIPNNLILNSKYKYEDFLKERFHLIEQDINTIEKARKNAIKDLSSVW